MSKTTPTIHEQAAFELLDAMQKRGIPAHMHEAVTMYVVHRIKPGSFLSALVENNLAQSFYCADEKNRAAIYEWVLFLYNDAPAPCWGSPAKVAAWLSVPCDCPDCARGEWDANNESYPTRA